MERGEEGLGEGIRWWVSKLYVRMYVSVYTQRESSYLAGECHMHWADS